MMAVRGKKHLRMEAGDWVFQWRRHKEPGLGKWTALVLVGCGFAFLVSFMRIHVVSPVPWEVRKGSVIHVGGDDAVGRSLEFRAREGGPFPSRFEPLEWEGSVDLEEAALGAGAWRLPPYQPTLRVLPRENLVPRVKLAAKGEPVFPKHQAVPPKVPAGLKMVSEPTLYPLSGIGLADLPRSLPELEMPVDSDATSEPWRFLLKLGEAGQVLECVSLVQGVESGADPSRRLESWMRGVTFPVKEGTGPRWIAVGLGFVNREADGPDAR